MRADLYSWRAKSDSSLVQDAQIDMLIDRADKVIAICEMKYTDGAYAFTREESEKLHRRGRLFREATQTRKAVSYVLVTPVGLHRNENAGDIQSTVTLDDLFRE